MQVRPGILFSSVAHVALLAYAIVGLSAAKPFEVGPTEALPIEILTPQEFDAMTKGSKTSKKVDAPKVKADKVAAADPEPVEDDVPEAKEDVKAPPPPPAPEPAKTEAPPKPEPKPEETAAKAEAEAEKAAKAAEAEKAAQEKAVAEKAAKAEAQKVAAEKAEKLAQAEGERLAKAEADKAAKAEAEKAAQEKADKLAKAEAEKAAKAEAEKAAKEKAEKLAKAEAAKAAAKAAERKFDPSKIASLLDKPSKSSSETAMNDVRDPGRKAVAARETSPETTAGTSRGTASKLSMSERTGIDNAVREQVMQCWNPPVGASGDGSLAVKVQFTLNADGTLSGGPTVTNSSSNPSFRAAAGAATRAVQRCAPLKLPAEAYDYWRQVNINFDPKDMMGG